jgi:hypothetical protein
MTDQIEIRELLVSSRVRRLEGLEPPHLDSSLTRVRRGYFRSASAELTADDEHRLRILATADARREELVFSHASAAVLWGCPILRADTGLVHATRPGKARRTTAGAMIHRSAIPDQHVETLPDGLLVTSRDWTAVQLAATLPLPHALLPLDHLVRQLTLDVETDPSGAAVCERLVELVPPGSRGALRAVTSLRSANALSGSPGESLSRGQMQLLDVPMPALQVAFPRVDRPGEDVVDFDWAELGVFGEFDGRGKYFRTELADGRAPEEVLWDEKRREDRIRHHRPRAVRWGWDDALSRGRLRRVLATAGIVPQAR